MIVKNWWNNIPYWLKGGLLFVCIAVLLFFLIEHVSNRCVMQHDPDACYQQARPIQTVLTSLSLSFDFIGLFICSGVCGAWNFTNLFTIWPSYFIIGSLLGWVYGRSKQENFITNNKLLIVLILILLSSFPFWYFHTYYFG